MKTEITIRPFESSEIVIKADDDNQTVTLGLVIDGHPMEITVTRNQAIEIEQALHVAIGAATFRM